MKQGKQISAVLFGVLAVFQMFIVRYMMNNAALTGVPIMVLAEIAAAPVFAAACVWLFSRDGVLSPVGKKVLAGSALFYLLFIAVYYDLEVNLILSGLSTLGQELANGLTPGYLGMAAKVVLLVLAANVRVVPQSRAFVIERLGAFQGVWGVGLHFKIPFIERVAKNVSLKEQVVDFPPQPVITKDNVTMQIDTVLYFQITDPKLYAYGVERPMSAIENLSVTTMRNIIGDMDLEQTLTSRDTINSQMRALLDEATDPWGIKVNRVEVKNIQPPPDIQSAMEKQMKAEREKREAVLRAEGQRQSQILVAEGEKESMILRADAAKQAAIKKAEGEAEAILKVQQATAEAIKLLNEADPREAVLRIKALEAFQAAADGKATKIIIPSEIQGLAGLCASAKAVFDSVEPNKPKPSAESK